VEGGALRDQLEARVRQFRRLLNEADLAADGGLFPVQTLRLPADVDIRRIHRRLQARGVRTVLRRGCRGREPAVSLVITARHRPVEIERAVHELAASTGRRRRLPDARAMSAVG
jgi:8-amino-7-oxononanoate synthase